MPGHVEPPITGQARSVGVGGREAAQERLRKLRQRAADAHRLIPEFEAVREASMAKIEAENALKRLVSHPQDFGHNLKPDDRRVIVATKHLEKMTADFEQLQELQQTRSAAWQSATSPALHGRGMGDLPAPPLSPDRAVGNTSPARHGKSARMAQAVAERLLVRDEHGQLRDRPCPSSV
jgi:hypothetical protein